MRHTDFLKEIKKNHDEAGVYSQGEEEKAEKAKANVRALVVEGGRCRPSLVSRERPNCRR